MHSLLRAAPFPGQVVKGYKGKPAGHKPSVQQVAFPWFLLLFLAVGLLDRIMPLHGRANSLALRILTEVPVLTSFSEGTLWEARVPLYE